jgi:hypothetical protein
MSIKLSCFCILLIFSLCAKAGQPSTDELISEYEKSLSALARAAYEIETVMVVETPQPTQNPACTVRKTSVCRDGNRWDVVVEDRSTSTSGELIISRCGKILDERSIHYESDSNEPPETVYVSSDLSEIDKVKVRACLGGGMITEGYLFAERLPDVFRNSSSLNVRNEKQDIDGYPTYVLESQSEYGDVTLWLDPNSGFHPRRIELHKSGDDILDGQPLASSHPNNKIFPPEPLQEYSIVVESVKIDQIGGTFVITGADVTESWIFSNGQVVRITYDLKLSKIDMNPDFNTLKAFVEIKVPDGTPAYDQDFPGINFVVVDGKIVPADDPTFDQIDKIVDELKQ